MQSRNVHRRLEQPVGIAEDWSEGDVVWYQSRPCVVMRDMRPQFERATIKFLDVDLVVSISVPRSTSRY